VPFVQESWTKSMDHVSLSMVASGRGTRREGICFSLSFVESPILPQRRFSLFVYGFSLSLPSSTTHEAGGCHTAYVYEPVLSFFPAGPAHLSCFPCSGWSIWKD
jgi:hypothetical protein